MTDKIIEAARLAGIEFQQHQGITGRVRTTTCGSQPIEKLDRFYAIAYQQALEDAAKAAEAQQDLAEQEKADKRFKAAMKDLEAGKATERNAVDRGDHWMCVATCNAVLRNAAKAIRSLKEQQHG